VSAGGNAKDQGRLHYLLPRQGAKSVCSSSLPVHKVWGPFPLHIPQATPRRACDGRRARHCKKPLAREANLDVAMIATDPLLEYHGVSKSVLDTIVK
jgi:hypothetical protein